MRTALSWGVLGRQNRRWSAVYTSRSNFGENSVLIDSLCIRLPVIKAMRVFGIQNVEHSAKVRPHLLGGTGKRSVRLAATLTAHDSERVASPAVTRRVSVQ